jgi:hypothetical protein
VEFYREVAPIIRDGLFRVGREGDGSHQHPTGWQIVTIQRPQEERLLVVWHRFGGPLQKKTWDLPAGKNWRVRRELAYGSGLALGGGQRLEWDCVPEWSGGVILLAGTGTGD